MSAKGTNYLKEIESRIKQTEDEIRHLKNSIDPDGKNKIVKE